MNKKQKLFFDNYGYLVLKNFFNYKTDILPIQNEISIIIDIIKKKYNIPNEKLQKKNFYSDYLKIIKKDRKAGEEIYDAIKNIYSFQKLITHRKLKKLYELLRNKPITGISPPSQGIRIDNPNENKFRSRAHQEFFYQPQSEDGVVFWSPLVDLKKSMGPLKIYEKSHKYGLLNYKKMKRQKGQPLGYSIIIDNKEKISEKYNVVEPILAVGDLIVMDFLTVHESGINRSDISRWTMQLRYFNFNDKKGIELGWKPSITSGSKILKIFKKSMS